VVTGGSSAAVMVKEGLGTREALARNGVELTAREEHRLIRVTDPVEESFSG
jgi:hypothetical protein